MKHCYVILNRITSIQPGCGLEVEETPIATTWAVSEKQAVNNYCYRTGRKKFERKYGYADFDIEIEIIARPYTTQDMERDKKMKGTRQNE